MSKSRIKPDELDETTLEDEEIATHQENVPLPWLAGTRRLAVRWLDGALNQITEQAPDGRPEKK